MTMEEIEEFLDANTIIIFDTNFWLDIYRTLPDEIVNALNLLNKDGIKDNVFVPSFIKKEFNKNYRKVISEHKKLMENMRISLKGIIKEFQGKIESNIKYAKERHRIIDNSVDQKLLIGFEKLIEVADEFSTPNETQTILDNDDILSRVKELFDEVADTQEIDCLSKQDIFDIFEEGERRFATKTPPGYMDKTKNETKGGFIYGDLIIWKEIIKYAKESAKNILFVTNDTKEDWFDDIGFHAKLISEFETETGRKLVGLSGKDFYAFAKSKFLNADEVLTDIDEYISKKLFEFSGNIESKIYDMVINELDNDGSDNNIYNPFEVLSEYDGSDYDFEELIDFDFDEVKFTRNGDTAWIDIKYKVKFTVNSAEYHGRDDDTKEVILSPTKYHTVEGIVTATVIKRATEFLFDLYNFDDANVFGDCRETEYDSGYLDESDDYYDILGEL